MALPVAMSSTLVMSPRMVKSVRAKVLQYGRGVRPTPRSAARLRAKPDLVRCNSLFDGPAH